MPKLLKIRVKDFYKDAIGEMEYTYVTEEVYEILANTFRKEAHAEFMRDLRHVTVTGYVEGNTEDIMMDSEKTLEEQVIGKMDLELLQIAMQSLTDIQKERLHLYFFKGLTTREIAEKYKVSQHVIWKSLQGAINKLKKFYD